MSMKRKIVVAMSGGVDSSVAALLLRNQTTLQNINHNEVIALFMSNWNPKDEDMQPNYDSHRRPRECWEKDRTDVEAVCQHLSIPLHKASFASEYWTDVFEPFVKGVANGYTSNPDVQCNARIKFGAMKHYVQHRLGVDWIATGHYARLWHRTNTIHGSCNSTQQESLFQSVQEAIQQHSWLYSWGKEDSHPLLLAGLDKTKDQSYFLAGVSGTNLRNVEFPLGDLIKTANDNTRSSTASTTTSTASTTVRSMAQEAQLPNASKRESMGICFVGKRSFPSFISQYLPLIPQSGNFLDIDTGEIVGTHHGALLFTIGQGAKIGGASQKWFVVKKDKSHNVFVCAGTHHPALYSNEMAVSEMSWVGGDLPPPLKRGERLRLHCRIRHLQPLIPCEMKLNHESSSLLSSSVSIVVYMDCPVRAITPGQMAVFYIGDVCLGGGIITERGASYHERGLDLPTTMLHPSGHNDLSVPQAQQIVLN